MTTSPYFRKRRRPMITRERDSPYFCQAPSSPFGAVQSMGTLLSCLGRTCIGSDGRLDHEDARVCHAIRPFQNCPVFLQTWGEESVDTEHASPNERRLKRSVRHLCRHGCYYRAYAPARAWWALHEALQSETTLPIQPLLHGWSCVLLLPCCFRKDKDTTPRVAFVDPCDQIVWSERDVLRRILGAAPCRTSGVASTSRLTMRKRSLIFTPEPTDEGISTKRSKTSHHARTKRRIIARTDSPFGLLEELFVDDPFRLLLSTIFLNRTTRIQVDAILCEFLEQWPTPESLLGAEVNHVVTVVRPLGMCHRRASGIQQFTREYLEQTRYRDARHWSDRDVQGLFYCGPYASDAYQLFVQRDGSVEPLDHALRAYVRYQRGLP